MRRIGRPHVPWLAVAAMVVAMGSPSVALAGDEDIAAARTLGQEGVLAAGAGRCDEAVEKLTRAKAIMPVPTILVPLGECQIKLGKIVAGTENLQTAIRYKLGPDGSEVHAKAQAKARAELPDALKRLGKLTLVIEAPEGAIVEVTDNGQRVSPALVGAEYPADPGDHVIVVSGAGLKAATATVSVPEAGVNKITIAVEKAPVEPDPKRTKPPGDETPKPPPVRGSSPLVPAGAVILSVGLAGVVVGGVFGGLALGVKSTLDDACDANKGCPQSSSGDLDDLALFSHASTGLFVAGGVVAAAGAVMLGIGAATNGRSTEARVRPIVGLGFIGVGGTL